MKFLLLASLGLVAFPAHAAIRPFAAAPVAEADLAEMRGGFALPGGIDIALAVQMDTAVDGALVLRTVFTASQGTPTLAVYAPAPGTRGPATATAPTATGANTPALILDRGAGTTTLEPGGTAPAAVAVAVGQTTVAPPAGLAPLPVAAGGPAIATGGGLVQLSAIPSGTRIELSGAMIDITQLVGATFVNMVRNSGNDRTIDTATTINVALGNTAATTAATAAARVADIAGQIAARLVR